MSDRSSQQARQGVDYGDEPDVQRLHVALGREKRDGRVTVEPFSVWVLVLFGLAFFIAGFWAARPAAQFTATTMESSSPAPSQSAPPAVQPSVAPASAGANANAPAVLHVAMKNMKFDPPKLEIHKGDTVEWTNDDITPHTATALPFFDSGSIASDKSWRHTFTEPGEFPYGCTFHPEMKAVITVK